VKLGILLYIFLGSLFVYFLDDESYLCLNLFFAGEVVTRVLKKSSLQANLGTGLMQASALAIAMLCEDSEDMRREFGQQGDTVNVLIEILANHQKLGFDTALLSSLALVHLITNYEANISKASFSSLADSLYSLLSKCTSIVMNTMNTALPSINTSIAIGTCNTVVTMNGRDGILKSLPDAVMEYELFIQCCCILTLHLCTDRVGAAGCCKHAVFLLTKYDKLEEQSGLICSVIAALAHKSADNQGRLAQAGACISLVRVLERYLSGGSSASIHSSVRPTVVIDGCAALTNLANDSEANKQKLISSNLVDMLTLLVAAPHISDTGKENAKAALDALIG
jgi:hypothetical protein